MNFLNEHARDFFIFFIVPLAGLLAEYVLSARRAAILAGCLGLFIFPAVIGYSFTFPWLGLLAEIVFFSCLYSLVSRQIVGNIRIYGSVILSFVLFVTFGSISVMNTDRAKTTLEHKWQVGHYLVEYVSDQSFDGGPLTQYVLDEYAIIPFYFKQIETVGEPEDMSACAIAFPKSKLVFDRCHSKISTISARR